MHRDVDAVSVHLQSPVYMYQTDLFKTLLVEY